ncbi:MAG: hypothetical protein OEW87_15270, partial [Flavobacteriaceae bacterium]|nr:hypothetical protein [Flavobacteriaceae bacterium]
MYKPIHFYVVFNPMLNGEGVYATQAHEFYYQLKNKVNQRNPENNHMYWGKLQVNNGSIINHLDAAKEVMAENAEHGEDTHLYITDFHHFWVAKVESIQKEILNPELTLPFYDN